MKVLHINSEKGWRGGEQQMVYLIEELASLGVENFICCRLDSTIHKYAQEKQIPHLALKFSGLKLLDSLKLKGFLRKQQIELIHTHTSNAHTLAFYASLIGATTPIIVSKRTDFKVKSPGKYNHSLIKKVICVSHKIAEITKAGVQNPDKVVTVYSGINTKRFDGEQNSLKRLLNLGDHQILIGNSSAIAPHKDYYTFLKVARNLPQYHFAIIGSGPLEDEIKKYTAENDIKNVHFTGFLPDLEKYLKSLDIFLITSETEGLGTSILDAMICRVPVVATAAGGIPEIVIDTKTGLLSPIKDVESLTQNISEILSNPELRETMLGNAYENVKTNFSKEATAQKTFDHYKAVLN